MHPALDHIMAGLECDRARNETVGECGGRGRYRGRFESRGIGRYRSDGIFLRILVHLVHSMVGDVLWCHPGYDHDHVHIQHQPLIRLAEQNEQGREQFIAVNFSQ